MSKRAVIVCTHEIATLLRAGKAMGVSVIRDQLSIDCNGLDVLVESDEFPDTPDGARYPRAVVKEQSDQSLKVLICDG